MNITKGTSAKKQHLSNGALTHCRIKTSGMGSNDFNDFKWWADNYPNDCCQKCLNRYNEKLQRLIAKKK